MTDEFDTGSSFDLTPNQQTQAPTDYPDFMVAANNHNTGNLNADWYGKPADNPNIGERVTYMAGSAALSAINSFYNTAVWAGNWFSDKDAQYRDTSQWIHSFDDNMGQYYDKNRQAADLLGFVVSSFVPGLGGIKILNAGLDALKLAKEGTVGLNMARGLGILPGTRAALVKEAVDNYATTRTAFKFSDPATFKALASGFGEQALQAAAFEVAVTATMKKSPILNDQDFGDIVRNVTVGAAVGGAIGGAIEGAISFGAIKKGISATDKALAPATQINRGVAGTSPADSILIRRNDLDTVQRNAPEGVDPATYGNLLERKLRTIDNKDREDFTKLAGGDANLGNLLYEGIRADPTSAVQSKLYNLESVSPIVDLPKVIKSIGVSESGDPQSAVRYFKLWGDDAGKMSDEAPAITTLADSLKKGQEIRITPTSVTAGKFSIKINRGKPWDVTKASTEEAQARFMWAMDDSVPELKAPTKVGYSLIGQNDIPMLTKAYRENFSQFKLIGDKGEILPAPADLKTYLAELKDKFTSAEVINSGGKISPEALALKYDVPTSFITEGQVPRIADDAIFGMAKAQKDYWNKFHANTPEPPPISAVKPWLKPQNYAFKYSTEGLQGIDNFQVEAMTLIKQRQAIQAETNRVAVGSVLGDKAGLLGDFGDAMLEKVNRLGSGSGLFSFTNGNYGSAGSLAESVGALVTKWSAEAADKVSSTFQTLNYKVLSDPRAVPQLAAILQKTRAAGTNQYVLDPKYGGLVLKKVRDYDRAVAAGSEDATPPIIPKGIDEIIPITNGATRDWVEAHIQLNGARLDDINVLRGAKGQPASLDPEVFYPPLPSPERFKFHAFAMDDSSITRTNHTSMLYATSAEDLQKQMAEAQRQGFTVVTPDDTANYFKARGKYDFEIGLNESQMDAALRRSGSSAPAFPLTGKPTEILDDLMKWHVQQEGNVIREAVGLNYSRQFGVLKQMGDEYSSLTNAKIGLANKLKGDVLNPFESYVKTFLGASTAKNYPTWTALNNFVDDVGSKVYGVVSSLFDKSKSYRDLEAINAEFKSYGLQMGSTPAQLEAWVNHPAGANKIREFVRTQNAILSTLILRLDPINSLTNALGSVVMTGPELRAVLAAARAGNVDQAGELTKLFSIKVPGVDNTILAPGKLYAQAIKDWFGPQSKKLLESYKKRGFASDISTQLKQILDYATIVGTETPAQLDSKLASMYAMTKKLVGQGEKWTGNKVAEEFNRFVSARSMELITNEAVKRGIIDQKAAQSYIQTFVNRTQGNIIASQRPQIFQGPIGQAIGLFQTYQFNIMQQLLRHVSEGSKKDALTLLGLQGTIFGMNGLPAFQAINQHIIGTASGNTNHTDAYNSVYNLAGKNAGDWLLYGAASNFLLDPNLKINLYSRGDINPRQVTVVPTNLADVPFVSAYAKLFSTIKTAVGNLSNGGDVWNTLLTGIEQQGLSRPLAGLARVARGFANDGVSFSTTGKGNIVSANDLYSLANLARITGAKPLDEAVAQDAVYRIQGYQAMDTNKRKALGQAVRTVITGGGNPTQDQLDTFMANYVATGGKQEEFTKWYTSQLRAATVPQANKLVQNIDSPYSKYMQSIMGGQLMKTPADVRAQLGTAAPQNSSQ